MAPDHITTPTPHRSRGTCCSRITEAIRIEEGTKGSRIVWTVACVSRILPKKSVQSRLEASYARLAAALAQEAEDVAD